MGTHKRVQRGHAVCHLVRIPITLGQARRHALRSREAAQIRARRLCADGHVRRLGFFADFHGQGIDRSGAIELDDRPVLHRDGRRAPVFRLANGDFYEIVLVRGGGGQANAGRAYGQRQGVFRLVRRKCRRQRTLAHLERRQPRVGAAPIAANVRAAVQRVHHTDLIVRRQFSIRHGVCAEAAAGKPVVERTHPARPSGAGTACQVVHGADIVAVGRVYRQRIARSLNRRGNAAHCSRIR